MTPPTIFDVRAAAARIAADIVQTPVLQNAALDRLTGGRVFLKADNLQRTGSFKFRGAINRIRALSAEERRRGVVAFSSGNHAMAVAEAARMAEVSAIVIMPSDAPAVKIEGARQRGAEVILYDRDREDREAIGRKLVAENGRTLIPPFDDAYVIAGQGTGALEAIAQIAAVQQAPVDQVVICCSGGGLASGWTLALSEVAPHADIISAEPAGFDDMARSLASGQYERNAKLSGSICDALLVQTPGKLTLPILLAAKARGVAVSDQQVLEAVRFASGELKLVVEPGGAAALAAVLSKLVDGRDKTTLLILSGGNVDQASLAGQLAA